MSNTKHRRTLWEIGRHRREEALEWLSVSGTSARRPALGVESASVEDLAELLRRVFARVLGAVVDEDRDADFS